jgi:ABC-type amino acid transport substrate-binding protein
MLPLAFAVRVLIIALAVSLLPAGAQANDPARPLAPDATERFLAQAQPAQPAPPATRPTPRPAAPPARPGQKPPPPLPPAFKITIVTEGGYPPFNTVDAKGTPCGFEIELAQALCQRIRAECKFVAAKWDDLLPGLLDHRWDAIFSSLEVSADRRRHIAFTRRYYQVPAAFVARKGSGLDGATALLKNKRVGVRKGTTHADWIERSYRRTIRLQQFDTMEQVWAGLLGGQLDAVFGDKVQLHAWLKSEEGACCEFFGQDVKDSATMGIGIAAGLRKDDVKLREALNKAISEIAADGSYRRINDKYFPFSIY